MKREGLLVIAAASAMAGVGITWSVQAQQPAAATRTLSIATLAPAGSTWARVFDAWNREVRRRSSNGLSLRFYFGGVQGDESEVIRKIRTGRLDGGAVTAVGLAQIHRPALTFQIPGMFAGYAQLDNARNALNAEISQSFQTAGFQLAGWADVGRSRVFSQAPVNSPSQLAAQRFWAWRDDAVVPRMLELAGVPAGNRLALGVPEVLGALQTNRINALVSSPVATLSLQWSSRLTHMTDHPVSVVVGATVFGQAQWATLTPDQQTILRETAAQFHALARRNLRSDETVAVTIMTQHGITAVPVDAAQAQAWNALFTQTRTALTGQVADAAFIARVAQLGH